MSEISRNRGDIGGGSFQPGGGEHRPAHPTYSSPNSAAGADRPPVPRRVSPMGRDDSIHARLSEPLGPREHRTTGGGAAASGPVTEPRANPITNFVLDSVGSFEELNAPNVDAGNQRFKEAAGRALQQSRVGEKLGEGGFFTTHRLEGRDDVVVKRMMPAKTTAMPPTADNPVLTQIFEGFEEDHEAVKTLLGPDHTPHTEFIVVEGTNFGDPDPNYAEGKEFVMLTEPLTGIKHNRRGQSNIDTLRRAAVGASPEMRAQVESYAARHRAAQAAGVLPDDEVDYDFDNNRVIQFDTNNPHKFQKYVDESDMINHFHPNPSEVTTPQALADFALSLTPELQQLRGRPWSEVREVLYEGSPLAIQASAELTEKQGGNYDFADLIDILDHFPPEGDSRYIREVIDAFEHPTAAEYTIVPAGTIQDTVHRQAMRGETTYSHLLYEPEGERYYIRDITAEEGHEGEGATRALLEDFVQTVGIGVPIRAEVAHLETRDALFAAGLDNQAVEQGEAVVTDPELLNNLPLVRVMLSGGIVIREARMSYNPENVENPLVANIYGVTNPARAARIREQLHRRETQEGTGE